MTRARRILVIDDEPSIREMLTIFLEEIGYSVATALSVASGIKSLDTQRFDLVMCDLKLPDGSGLEVLQHARNRPGAPPFIIITAHTTPNIALEALRAGASEYLSKPFNVDDLRLILIRLLTKEPPPSALTDSNLIGASPAMGHILEMIPRIAATPSTVLITGESGTGKELVALAIHKSSPLADGPFLSINCGALPEGLLESELFGHIKGSFTGAFRDHVGLFAKAQNGIIFLDEVGELTLAMQVKLLRVLQERRVRPVGATNEVEVNARVLAATNSVLREKIRAGAFREDLFYRLNVVEIHLPPLRERLDDLPDMARLFVDKCCARFKIPPKRLSPDAIRVLRAHAWPGNVRELENIIERTIALEPGELISSGSLPDHLRGGDKDSRYDLHVVPEEGLDLEEYLSGLRANLMHQALERSGGNQKKAARLLRLSYRAFRYHAEKLGLARELEDR
ncbi:MAG: sigma-54 dependent transcriptional regulator [Thermoanaerobaculales bacterium]|nr:sigma-54 dependent transcriptional regulator [Thermoanaerobaculales bacterium]